MTDRREVRVAESFFEDLDLQLGGERGPNGEPSATDFLVVDLPAVVEVFVTEFDSLPETIGGVGSMRMFIGTSALAYAFVVYGIETSAGVIELVGIELQL